MNENRLHRFGLWELALQAIFPQTSGASSPAGLAPTEWKKVCS
jgi:hypothetical protein